MSDRWYDEVERLWFKLGNGPMGQSRLYLAGKLSDQPGVRWDDQAQAGVAVALASQDISNFGPWSRTDEILARRIAVLQSSQEAIGAVPPPYYPLLISRLDWEKKNKEYADRVDRATRAR